MENARDENGKYLNTWSCLFMVCHHFGESSFQCSDARRFH